MAKKKRSGMGVGLVEMIKCDCGHSIPKRDWKPAKLCPGCGRDSSWITMDPSDLGLNRDRAKPTMV